MLRCFASCLIGKFILHQNKHINETLVLAAMNAISNCRIYGIYDLVKNILQPISLKIPVDNEKKTDSLGIINTVKTRRQHI